MSYYKQLKVVTMVNRITLPMDMDTEENNSTDNMGTTITVDSRVTTTTTEMVSTDIMHNFWNYFIVMLNEFWVWVGVSNF